MEQLKKSKINLVKKQRLIMKFQKGIFHLPLSKLTETKNILVISQK